MTSRNIRLSEAFKLSVPFQGEDILELGNLLSSGSDNERLMAAVLLATYMLKRRTFSATTEVLKATVTHVDYCCHIPLNDKTLADFKTYLRSLSAFKCIGEASGKFKIVSQEILEEISIREFESELTDFSIKQII